MEDTTTTEKKILSEMCRILRNHLGEFVSDQLGEVLVQAEKDAKLVVEQGKRATQLEHFLEKAKKERDDAQDKLGDLQDEVDNLTDDVAELKGAVLAVELAAEKRITRTLSEVMTKRVM